MVPAARWCSRIARCRPAIASPRTLRSSTTRAEASRKMLRSISASAAPPTRPRSTTRSCACRGPIIEHQAIGAKLAEIAIRLEVARAAIWQAAWASDHPDAFADRSLPDLPLATIAAVFASEAIYRAAKDAAECFGAMGGMRDMPLQQYVPHPPLSLPPHPGKPHPHRPTAN